jgi:ABC-type bacteriocin/lantibiotic exporter with double-glycine peptidase domain
MKDKKLGYFGAIKFLSKYISRHKRNFIMFYFGWFFDMLLSIVMPILFGVMIDEIVYHQNVDSFLRISLVFVIMSAFSCLLYFLIYAQHQYLMSMYCFDIQRDIFRHLQKCSPEHLSDAKSGDIVTLIQQYARECMHFVIRNIFHITNGIIEMILLTMYVFIISPLIGLLVLIAAPVSVFVGAKFGKKIRGYSNEQREIYGGYVSFIYEVFTAIRDIRLLGAKRKVNRKVVGLHREMYHVGIKSGVSSITAQNIIDGTNLVIQLAIFTLAAWLVGNGDMTIGLLTVVLAYFASLTGRVRQVSGSYLDAQNRVGYIQRIYDFMNTPTEENWRGINELSVTNGEISFENVTFAYKSGGDVLQNMSLHIGAGERFALCGKSGCGKTTLGYMMIGFYAAQAGEIKIDGQRLSDCSLRSIRKNIGMVSQDVLLFEGSIKDNLLLGKLDASDDEIHSALVRAGIGDYVASLPDGINTVIGAGGTGLSGGQKQRIAIARIYLKDPKIIIFDEATSSLDDETERQIHAAWEAVLAGRTSIIIAHRQSSVMLCGHAAIMENGHIAEMGDPHEMERTSDRFRTLFAIKEAERDAV